MTPTWLSPAADWLSLAGFGLTLWVLFVTRSLKREFTLRARTPEIRKSVAAATRSLLDLLSTWPTRKNEIPGLLSQCRAMLENLLPKLPRAERAAIAKLIVRLKGRRVGWFSHLPLSQYDEDELWDIFADLQGVVTSLEQREKDASWS